jgi:hypothetical protein
MLGKAVLFAVLTAGLVVTAGCHHDKFQVKCPPKEECVLPPDDARFNDAPTQGYRKRPPKPEDKSLMGGGGMGRGPMGGGPGGLNPGGF